MSNVPSVDATVPAELEITGNLSALLSGLTEVCREGSGWGPDAASSYRVALSSALAVPTSGLSPQRAIEIARSVLPRDTVATCDAGASRLLVVQKWQSYGPRDFLTSNGLASMGYAVPGALAARLRHPDRPVVAFTGDGGMLMSIAELQTSVRERLPITVVVFDDEEIGLIRVKQEIKGLDRYGIGIGGLDWESLARGLGAVGVTVTSENAFMDALSATDHLRETTLIAVKIDGSCYVDQFNALREL